MHMDIRGKLGVVPQVLPTFLVEIRSLIRTWESKLMLDWFVSELQGSSCLHRPRAGAIIACHHAFLYADAGVSLHASVGSTVWREPSPKTAMCFPREMFTYFRMV